LGNKLLDYFSEQAQEMHEFIREVVLKAFVRLTENVSILYGGSVKPENKEIFSKQMLMED
jgi:triosephosphate isomerase